jgi:tetratricopeptide (TPR) repeat protein
MAFYGLGHVFASQGNFTEAIQNFKQASRIRPDKAFISLALGRAMALTGRYDEATTVMLDCTARHPKHIEALYFLGLLFTLNEQYERAVNEFDNALKLLYLEQNATRQEIEKKWLALYDKAYEIENEGKLDQAIGYYEKIIDHQPDFHMARYRLSQIFLSMHDYTKALAIYHIKKAPDRRQEQIVNGYNRWKLSFQ